LYFWCRNAEVAEALIRIPLKDSRANLQATVSSKDMELVNLNSALGQYYAETEAKVSNFAH
jgi:hypothetical protein